MYGDQSPIPDGPNRVLVLEEGDLDVEDIIENAHDEGAVSEDSDGDEIFYIVFADKPGRLWDFTEKTLRQALAEKAKKLAN